MANNGSSQNGNSEDGLRHPDGSLIEPDEECILERRRLDRQQVRQVIIIGSGPAGLTAALYAARANLHPLVLEGDGFEQTHPGGQLMATSEIENFPGMYKMIDGKFHGMEGPAMMDLLRAQAVHFGAESQMKRVTKVDFRCRPFRVEVDGEKFYGESVIIATGASAKYIGAEGEEEYKNYGVTACATCDGALFKDKDVIVVGGGDTAMEEATFLTRHCRTVTVIHRRDQLRASRIMEDRAKKNPKIHFIWNAEVVKVYGKKEGMRKFLTGVTLRDTVTGETREHATDGVFVAIGHKPNTDLFQGILTMDSSGYIHTTKDSTFTNVPGVFACGDCQDHVYRQAITAAGTGCMSAIDAERFITANELKYGIDTEVSGTYERILEKSVAAGDEMPIKEPTLF